MPRQEKSSFAWQYNAQRLSETNDNNPPCAPLNENSRWPIESGAATDTIFYGIEHY
jgi:hypothetical protein